MAVLKFKSLEDVDILEGKGKGINWRFNPDKSYHSKALNFSVRVPVPRGVHKFKSLEEAATWERKYWIRYGASKRTR